MICHFFGANVVDIGLSVFGEIDSFLNAFLELSLVKAHLQHEHLEIVAFSTDATIVLVESWKVETALLSLLHLQELALNARIHQFEPEGLLRRFAG
jgi:hypothetical protein